MGAGPQGGAPVGPVKGSESGWLMRGPLTPARSAMTSILCNPQAQRAAHASELMAILHSLWDACGVAPEAPERSALSRLMGGALRLHTRSLEKCMGEVQRCEEAKVAQMLEIVNDKARCVLGALRPRRPANGPDGVWASSAAIGRGKG